MKKTSRRTKNSILILAIIMTILPLILFGIFVYKINQVNQKTEDYLNKNKVTDTCYSADESGESLQDLYAMASGTDYEADRASEADQKLEKDTTSTSHLSSSEVTPTDASATDAAEMQAEAEEDDVEYNGKTVYLTFDDGPSIYTDQILDILKEKNVKATFFLVAKDYTYSEEMNRIVNEGHTIAMHSSSHDYSVIYKNLSSFKRDVKSVHDIIYDVTGVDAWAYRFPGGSSNTVSQVPIDDCVKYLDSQGYVYFDWNALNDDATSVYYTPEELNQIVMTYVNNNPGDSMVLLHDLETHESTVKALPDLIDQLKEEGYRIQPITKDTPTFQHYVPEENTEDEKDNTNKDSTSIMAKNTSGN